MKYFDRALIIAEPWISLILSGKKTWEMRSAETKIRGRVGLIRKGSGLIVGSANIVDSLPYQHLLGLFDNFEKHQVIPASLGKWRYPWVMEDVDILPEPMPYCHPRGAVIWVRV